VMSVSVCVCPSASTSTELHNYSIFTKYLCVSSIGYLSGDTAIGSIQIPFRSRLLLPVLWITPYLHIKDHIDGGICR